MAKAKYAAVGGQAVMDGIMMRSPRRTVLAVRTPNGEIVTEDVEYHSLREKYAFFRLPIIRGVVSFIDGLIMGYKTLMRSAELSGLEEETNGNKVVEAIVMTVSMILGIGLALGLFIFLPQLLSSLIEKVMPLGGWLAPVEGVIRMALFLIYILLVSLMPDIHKMFQYHGAEHKSIFCLEAGCDLSVDQVHPQSRLHPRCGTSFLFLVMLISIFVFAVATAIVPAVSPLSRSLLKILLMPLVAGISFEVLQFTGRHDNWFTRLLSAPGKAFQKITTKEPTDDQIEVALVALKESLRDRETGELDFSDLYMRNK